MVTSAKGVLSMEEFTNGFSDVDVATVAIVAMGVLVAFFVFLWIISRILVICGPNEVVVISGRQHRLADGSTVGYKVLHGGRGLRIPVIEEINRMDTRLIPVMVEVRNAYSQGGIPLLVHAVANVKISADPTKVRNAIERLLSLSTRQIASVAQQTLEGALREVVAELTPEEVNQDRLKFAETLIRNAKDDFDKLGLELDVLKIQSVSDEQNYLRSLGRAQIAGMVRDAENAENQSKQTIAEATAAAKQRSETAAKQAEATVLTRRNELRGLQAQLDGDAQAVENEAKVAAETARAEAEQELQTLRAELERERLKVDVFIPAEANRRAAEANAKGEAAPVLQSGRANAEALSMVAEAWAGAGEVGRELYVLQHLKAFVEAATKRVQSSEIGELSVVDGGDGHSYASALAMYPAAVAEVLRATGEAVGIDVSSLLSTHPKGGK
jgi:flotillin